MDGLCRIGLGTLWFTKEEEPLELDLLNAEELNYLLISLYPKLMDVPYQFCRAGGPSHQIIVPFAIEDASKVPAVDQSFSPYFTVSMLKALVGRKGRLYIRPMKPLKEGSEVSQYEVVI